MRFVLFAQQYTNLNAFHFHFDVLLSSSIRCVCCLCYFNSLDALDFRIGYVNCFYFHFGASAYSAYGQANSSFIALFVV